MKTSNVLIIVMLSFTICSSASAQNFFDQLKRGVEREINNAVRNNQPQPATRRPPQQQPQAQSFGGVPSESKKNLTGPGWGGGGDFAIQPQPQPTPRYVNPTPRYVQPQPTPRVVTPYVQQQQPYVQTQPYVSQPYVQRQPHYVNSTPAYSQSSSFVVPGPPVSVANKVRIHCTDSSQGTCQYTLVSSFGNYPFSISAGQEQRFDVTTNWKIRLKTGGKMKTFNLKGGKLYRLKNDGSGWQLYISD